MENNVTTTLDNNTNVINEDNIDSALPASNDVKNSTQKKIFDIISFISRFGLSFVWIKAGLSKIDPNTRMEVTQNIMAYQIFTPQWSDYLSQIIGTLELAGGLILLLGINQRFFSKVQIGVLTLFIIGLSQAWMRGLNLDCGCFSSGVSQEPQSHYLITIVRDFVFILIAMWNIYRPYVKFALFTTDKEHKNQ